MKRILSLIHFMAVLLVASLSLPLGGCTFTDEEGFAIYLTEGDIYPDRMPVLSHVEIEEQPVIGMDDITTYNAQAHEMLLTADATERLSGLEVPVEGRSFVVCVDGKPVYFGAFWTPVSSISFDGVTIMKLLNLDEPHIVKLDLGYPSSDFYGGEDPRNNPEVLEALEKSGKLINRPVVTSIEKLPHSMKGYELYSWPEDNQWHFTLITGTNRNKRLEEIVSKDDDIAETGWVKISAQGEDAIKVVLSKLPLNESVFWCDGTRLAQTEETSINMQLPPENTIDTIKEHAEQCGLNLVITVQ